MWILKDASLGILFFLLGSEFYFLYAVHHAGRPVSRAEITIHNPAYWLAFVLTIIASCALMRFAPYITPVGQIMWIAKGTLLGLWLLGFGTMALLYFAIYRNLPPNSVVAVSGITAYTTQNPLWWTAFAVSLVLGYAIARSWPGPPILWIALLVTGSIPARRLALFIMLGAALKRAIQGLPKPMDRHLTLTDSSRLAALDERGFSEPRQSESTCTISTDCVFDASPVPETCPDRFVDSKELIKQETSFWRAR